MIQTKQITKLLNGHTLSKNHGRFLVLLLFGLPFFISTFSIHAKSLSTDSYAKSGKHSPELTKVIKELAFIQTHNQQPEFLPLFENETENENIGKKEPGKIAGVFCLTSTFSEPKFLAFERKIYTETSRQAKKDKQFIRLRVLRI